MRATWLRLYVTPAAQTSWLSIGASIRIQNGRYRVIGVAEPKGSVGGKGRGIAFVNSLGIPQSVNFAWTNAASMGQSFLNGAIFGLVSVDLADPVSPSSSALNITFNGYKSDGSMVSQTFTTPGSGSSFQTYFFNSFFATDLVRVEMPSSAWAMDNLVFVPEPSAGSFLLAGLLAMALRKIQTRRGK